jgi:GAF domain-containing protein
MPMTSDDASIQYASVARQLLAEPDEEHTLERAVDLTVDSIDACHHAGITIVHGKGFETPAATSELVRRGDELQYELVEGPCIDSLRQQQTVISPDLAQDQRWPTWGPRVVDELGVRSMLCFQLFTDVDSLGALNLYSEDVGAFDGDAEAIGLTLAAQIAVALQASREISTRDQSIVSRTVIGQAQGILMERFGVNGDQAFQVLRRVSQGTNTKLVTVARNLVRDRKLP